MKILSGGKPVRDRDGKIIQAADFQKGESETKPGQVQPDRRWFVSKARLEFLGNTRVISQSALDHFRSSLSTKKDDPYSVLLHRNKLPMALLDDAANPNLRKACFLDAPFGETEPFSETFRPKAQRKRPRLDVGSFEELSKVGTAAFEEAAEADSRAEGSSGANQRTADQFKSNYADQTDPIFAKGTSRQIYGELYKVIDSSDVILHILDARDPLGTICESVLEYMKKEKGHKHVVLVINKCDLVPNWVMARYIQHLAPRYPTIAFHASPNHSFGKGSLIQLLRQFSRLHSDKKQISVGFMGYPNVGESSIINTLKSGKVCRVAPVPGETKVWQYINLTKRIYLIDCPGIPLYFSRTYGVPLPDSDQPSRGWDAEDFLNALARMKGRLLKGGEPDVDGVAKIMLNDWVRGRVPFFVPPPERPEGLNEAETKAKLKLKGKEKAEQAEVLGVKRNLKSIVPKNTFLPEDVQPLENENGASDVDEEDSEGESDEEIAMEQGPSEEPADDEE
ncbi:hypothetical protein PISMIDRAFT_648197 [Pisolithus microcarpus 441]|uniref:Nucleolar GTP-binding protein 2 n=1 Tax=Pisolithus microcarpus 441 TaxID=765257 RepID=A0A0D0A6B3_9AGAM|nr:hypothetical protein PISMIDRAFT_648197 [Pisolithus microcarpus 441]